MLVSINKKAKKTKGSINITEVEVADVALPYRMFWLSAKSTDSEDLERKVWNYPIGEYVEATMDLSSSPLLKSILFTADVANIKQFKEDDIKIEVSPYRLTIKVHIF